MTIDFSGWASFGDQAMALALWDVSGARTCTISASGRFCRYCADARRRYPLAF